MRKIEIELQDGVCYQPSKFDCPCLSFSNNIPYCEKYGVDIKTEGSVFYKSCEQCKKDSKEIKGGN